MRRRNNRRQMMMMMPDDEEEEEEEEEEEQQQNFNPYRIPGRGDEAGFVIGGQEGEDDPEAVPQRRPNTRHVVVNRRIGDFQIGPVPAPVRRLPNARAYNPNQLPAPRAQGVRRGREPDPANNAALQQGLRGRWRGANRQLLRNRTWMVTIRTRHNPPNMVGHPVPGAQLPTVLDYQVGQMERGQHRAPGQAGLHWQGYLEFSQPITGPQLLAFLQNFLANLPGINVHVEPRFGSQQQAIEYVSKEETRAEVDEEAGENFVEDVQEYGNPHPPDAAGAIGQVQAMILNGANLNHFLHNNNVFGVALRCINGVQRMIQANAENDEAAVEPRDVKVILYYGAPRTGKSGAVYRWCREKELPLWKKPREASQHFTGYDKQPVLLLEEFGNADNSVTPGMAQEILDRYPVPLKVMYGTTIARWNTVFICTNVPPSEWYPRAHPDVRLAIVERIDEIWRFSKDDVILEKGPGDYAPIPDPAVHPPPNIIRRPAVAAPVPAAEADAGPAPAHPDAELIRLMGNIREMLRTKNLTHEGFLQILQRHP